MMLGDLGARVIKVETPDGGDDSRGWGPPFVEGESTYYLSANRNKESVTADLKSAEGKEFLTRLVRRADILVENFRPGVLDRLGFSVERLHELNPGLGILSITGFGHDGPEGGRAGYDQIAQGEGGLMSITGETEPTKVGAPIADLLAGMYGAYGAFAALHERSITGKGRVVRTSLLASVVGVHAFHGTKWTIAHQLPGRVGNHHAQIAPYGLYRTQDDTVQVAVGSEGLWRLFAPIVDLDPADERFAVTSHRVAQRAALPAAIEAAFGSQPADVWLKRLAEKGIPAGKVRDFQQVYEGDKPRSQACSSMSTIRRSAPSSCPARRCASTTTSTPAHAKPTSRHRDSASTMSPSELGWTQSRRTSRPRCNAFGRAHNVRNLQPVPVA